MATILCMGYSCVCAIYKNTCSRIIQANLCRTMAGFLPILLVVGFIQLVSCAELNDFVECGPVDTACECDAEATVCSFQFYVEHIFTFSRYNSSVPYAHGQGEIYYIDEEGNFVSYRDQDACIDGDFIKQIGNGSYCNKETGVCIDKSRVCSDPITVDGKTFKAVIAVNKQFPGPTLIVSEGQIVAVDVHNNLTTEAISIHWHGQHQIQTNFMDGVGHITQCPILPRTSFRYIFRAGPSGTFWYHSHMGSQRANGLFGALVVREREMTYPIAFRDDPASHTISLMDWFERDGEIFFQNLQGNLGQYPDLRPNVLPSDLNPAQSYNPTKGPDDSRIGINPFWSILFNGKGRHETVPYERSSLAIFEVEQGQIYRFRLIHTGTMYGLRFSIHNHTLKVMATDGYLVEPVEVDYIAIHSGERYDFLLEANQGSGDYWMKAETFEIDVGSSSSAPYSFFEHSGEAILHYSGSDKPRSTEYVNISSSPRQCTQDNPCTMLNCPFGHYHPSYNIECIGVEHLRLAEPTPDSEMPDESPDVTHFLNMAGFRGRFKPISSINKYNFRLPEFPPATHYDRNDENAFCDVNSECDSAIGCECTTVLDIGKNVTVRLVISSVGHERNMNHPIHIHGHTVHILKVGYGEYDSETGLLESSSRDITCTDTGDDFETLDESFCNNPRFRSPDKVTLSINTTNVRKDTFNVPSGGYIVVQFRSDNPGYWLLHCHIELHQRWGMALIMREAVDEINPPPEEMKTCHSFMWEIDDFMSAIEGDSASIMGANLLMSISITIIGTMLLC